MRRFEFTEEELRTIAHERYYHPNPRVQRRMEILWLKSKGETHERIADLAKVGRRTVQRLLDSFEKGRLEFVRSFGEKGRENGLAPHCETLEASFRERPPRSVAEARQRIKELTGIERGFTQVRLFLKDRLGFHWRKTGAVPVPPKQSVEEHARTQAAFFEGAA
jgi:transposase